MRNLSFALAALALPLAACGSNGPDESSGENLSVEEVAERAKAAGDRIRPEPGLYRSTTEIRDVEIPGAPAQMVEMMRGNIQDTAHEYCLTQEDADRGFEEMAKRSQEDMNCTFDKFDIDDGDFDAAMTCDVPGQGRMAMTMNGTGTSTSSEMDMAMTGNIGGMGEMKISMKTTQERIGDCPG